MQNLSLSDYPAEHMPWSAAYARSMEGSPVPPQSVRTAAMLQHANAEDGYHKREARTTLDERNLFGANHMHDERLR